MKEGTLEEQKAKAITKAYYESIKSWIGLSLSSKELIHRFASLGAPRFFVSYEKASRFVSMLHRGIPLPLKTPHKIALYKELHKRYENALLENPQSSYNILRDIILEPAPSFYLSEKSLRELINYNLKKRWGKDSEKEFTMLKCQMIAKQIKSCKNNL